MNHQDWNTIVIKKKQQPKQPTSSNKSFKKGGTPETFDVFDKNKKNKKLISSKLAKHISQKRCSEPNSEIGDKHEKCNSVKLLAQKINCNVVDVRKCEISNSEYDHKVLNKIKRYLNINSNTF
tara:strand:- start:24 stop:392 length:369 start_codon:yes stop_codon:yes gene_type:complete